MIDLAPHGIDLVGVLLGGDDLEHLHVTLQSRVHRYPVDDGGAPPADRGLVQRLEHVREGTADGRQDSPTAGPAPGAGRSGPGRSDTCPEDRLQ